MTEHTETWLPVTGWEGLYEVSDHGRTRSLDRFDRRGRRRWGRVLKPFVDRDGYHCIILKRDGIRVGRKVHHMVLEAFDRPCPEGMQTRHGPGGPGDNRWPENICWGTPRENEADKLRDGTRRHGSGIPWAKLTPDAVLACRARRAAGALVIDLASEYGVSKATMSRALRGVGGWGWLK